MGQTESSGQKVLCGENRGASAQMKGPEEEVVEVGLNGGVRGIGG